MKWSEADLAAYNQRTQQFKNGPKVPAEAPPQIVETVETSRPVAKGKQPEQTGMNKTETAYSNLLEIRKRAGEVAWYRYEGITLKLAHDTRYTPDFAVMLADGTMEMHETKGFMRDDAAVKLKTAASMFPFRFFLIRLEKGEWNIREVKG